MTKRTSTHFLRINQLAIEYAQTKNPKILDEILPLIEQYVMNVILKRQSVPAALEHSDLIQEVVINCWTALSKRLPDEKRTFTTLMRKIVNDRSAHVVGREIKRHQNLEEALQGMVDERSAEISGKRNMKRNPKLIDEFYLNNPAPIRHIKIDKPKKVRRTK